MSGITKFALGAIFGAGIGTYLTNHFDDILHQLSPNAANADQSYPNEPVSITTLEPISPAIKPESLDSTKPVQSRVSEIMKFGYPGFETLRTFEDFVLSYDRRNKVPHWVLEHLTPEQLLYAPGVDRKKSDFTIDSSLHPYFRSTNEDYLRTGFDRGHMAAAANHRKSQNSINQTFFLTNMAPQIGIGFNRGKWSDLEKYIRGVVRKSKNVYVCTGPLYLPMREADGKLYVKYQVIGKNNVAVPTHFFKAMLIEDEKGQFRIDSYVMPNAPIDDNTHLKAFRVPLDSIERSAGFLIFENVPKSSLKMIQ